MRHLPIVYQHPQHGAVIAWDLDTRPGGPHPPSSPEIEEPLSYRSIGVRC